MCLCVWKQEVHVSSLLLTFSALFLDMESLSEPETTSSGRLPILPVSIPGTCYVPCPALLCGSEDTISGPRIFMASTLPADPCPQLPKLVLHKI